MLFNSQLFLLFFPVVTLVYFVLPHRVRYLWLLAASYYFYMCWNAKYALLLLTSTAITYGSGLLLHRTRSQGIRRVWVALSVASNLGILFFFKYYDFAVSTLQRAANLLHLRLRIPAFDVLLPVGISFYIFQALSYTMDVYRQELEPERNFFRYALFVSFFPQLVAGPIERSTNLLPQMSQRHYFDADRVRDGLQLMLWGFFEKIVIADRAAIVVNQVYEHYQQIPSYGMVQILAAALLFSVQIYCDFGGYSHIAIGAAQVMGFELMDNFRQPYFATSIREFWHRWHISLSTWFRDYLYIPLGGSRCGTLRRRINLMITFLVSGLWHGAAWNFVIWGGLHGLYQIVGEWLAPAGRQLRQGLHIAQDSPLLRAVQRLWTFLLVTVAWMFFRASGMRDLILLVQKALGHRDWYMLWNGALLKLGLDGVEMAVLLAAMAVLFVVDLLHEHKVPLRQRINAWPVPARWAVSMAGIAAVLLFGIYGAGYEAGAFIYFQF